MFDSFSLHNPGTEITINILFMGDQKTIKVDFVVNDEAVVIANGVRGKVIAVFVNKSNVPQYLVEYVDSQSAVHSDYFFADQLTA